MPFQWDNSTSAGFSVSNETWLLVNSNYKTLNLVAQKAATVSYYSVFKSLLRLKRKPVVERGSLHRVGHRGNPRSGTTYTVHPS